MTEIPEQEQTNHNGDKQQKVEAQVVNISQGGASEITADEVHMSESGAVRITAGQATIDNSLVLAAQTGSLNLTNGAVLGVQAREAMISGAVGVVTADTVSLNDSRAGVVVGREVHGSSIQTTILLAGKVDAPVQTQIDARGLLLFGVVAGMVMGVITGLMRIIFGPKR